MEGRDLVFLIGGHDGLPAGWARARRPAALAFRDDVSARTGARHAGRADLPRVCDACEGILTRAKRRYACMSWFQAGQTDAGRDKIPKSSEDGERAQVRTEGLWQKCEGCRQIIWKKDLEANSNVCPKCGMHFRIDARDAPEAAVRRRRLRAATTPTCAPPIRSQFVDSKPYSERLRGMQQATNLSRRADLRRRQRWTAARCNICAMEPKFIGGSMGCVVGEKITRAIERSHRDAARR